MLKSEIRKDYLSDKYVIITQPLKRPRDIKERLLFLACKLRFAQKILIKKYC